MRKRLVVVVLLLCGLVLAAWRYWPRAAAPVTTPPAVVGRGDVRRVVAATARVVAHREVEIKCKASGTVIAVPKEISEVVKTGDLLLELDPVDEQRAVAQAEAAVSASQARLVQAQENLALAEATLVTDGLSARAALAGASARASDLRAQADRLQQLRGKKVVSQEESEVALANALQAEAARDQARAAVEALQARSHQVELRRQDVRLAEVQLANDRLGLENARQRLADTKVFAPMDGVITACPVQVGSIVSSGITNIGGGSAVLTVADLSRIFALASVDESDIGTVAVGQEVGLTVDAFPNRRFQGRVVRIATKGFNVSNVVTFEVKIEFLAADEVRGKAGWRKGGEGRPKQDGERLHRRPRPDHPEPAGEEAPGAVSPASLERASRPRSDLRPEMTANIEIATAERLQVLVVPSEALRRSRDGWMAQVVDGQGKPQERPVEVGITDGVHTEVRSGLAEGEKVILRRKTASSRWQGQNRPPPPPHF